MKDSDVMLYIMVPNVWFKTIIKPIPIVQISPKLLDDSNTLCVWNGVA